MIIERIHRLLTSTPKGTATVRTITGLNTMTHRGETYYQLDNGQWANEAYVQDWGCRLVQFDGSHRLSEV